MNFRNHTKRRGQTEVSLTPLVDIVFILLIFFLITSTFVQNPGIEVDLPKSTNSPTAIESDNIIMAVTKNGVVIHEGKTMSADQLRKRLAEHYKVQADQLIVIQADSAAAHGKVVELMDLAQSTGFSRLAIATEEGN